jgi:hypothetical protein
VVMSNVTHDMQGNGNGKIRLGNANNRQGDGRSKHRAGWGTDHVGTGSAVRMAATHPTE